MIKTVYAKIRHSYHIWKCRCVYRDVNRGVESVISSMMSSLLKPLGVSFMWHMLGVNVLALMGLLPCSCLGSV